MSHLYLYCITKKEDLELESTGIEGNAVYSIPFRKVQAVVSEAGKTEYEPDEQLIKQHKEVTSEVLENHSVLPVAYGMAFKNKKILRHNLNNTYALLRKSLLSVRRKIELGVKVFQPSDTETNFNPENFLEPLEEIAVKTGEGDLFTDKLLLNHSFLVKRGKQEEFTEQIQELEEKYDDLKIKYTGPWPPYNFVDVHIIKS